MPARHTTRRILVPLEDADLGHAVIPHLRALANVESELMLLRVIPESLPVVETVSGDTIHPDSDRARAFDECHAELREIAASLRDTTPYVEMLTSIGSPADEILRVAEHQRIDLIVMPTRDLGAENTPIAVSVANRVAQASTVPVMLLRLDGPQFPDATARYGCVVVPLDGSARARTALPVAAALARRQTCPVRLVRVIPTREEMFAGHDPADRAQAAADDRYYAAYREEQMRALRMEACAMRAPDIATVTELLTGSPAEAITEALGSRDMLVLASHGEGGVRPWLLGHTAQQLIATATSPVVLVPVEERQAVTLAIRGEAPVTVQRTPIREQAGIPPDPIRPIPLNRARPPRGHLPLTQVAPRNHAKHMGIRRYGGT